jgi:hypothetical protein
MSLLKYAKNPNFGVQPGRAAPDGSDFTID